MVVERLTQEQRDLLAGERMAVVVARRLDAIAHLRERLRHDRALIVR
jgi:hypothetical protein